MCTHPQAFIGDRYGYRPFPANIPEEEYDLFLRLGALSNINTSLLSKWYKLDKNALEPVYQLLPITTHYPNYSSPDDRLRSVDRDSWWEAFKELQQTLWKLVEAAVEKGHMRNDRAHVYLQSGMFA